MKLDDMFDMTFYHYLGQMQLQLFFWVSVDGMSQAEVGRDLHKYIQLSLEQTEYDWYKEPVYGLVSKVSYPLVPCSQEHFG